LKTLIRTFLIAGPIWLLAAILPLGAQTLKPADPAADPTGITGPSAPMDFPAPGEGAQIGKMPKVDGTLAKIRAKYFYLGELTWRGGVLLAKETTEWGESRKNSIEQDLFRQVSLSNSSTNVKVPIAQNNAMNYVVGIEGLLGVNLDQLPGFRGIQSLKGKKFFRLGFHAYMAPYYKQTTQTVSGPFSYNDPSAIDGAKIRTYAGQVNVDENLLHVSPGMSFFYWYESGLFDRRIMPYLGVEVGLSLIYGKRKYAMQTEPFSTTVTDGGGNAYAATYRIEGNLQESIINDFGFRVMPALGFQWHVTGGHYLDVRVGYQFQEYNATLNRRGSLTETQTDQNGNFKVTWSEDFLNKSQTVKLSQSGIVILLGYTAGLF
jgi:hypothetical protein